MPNSEITASADKGLLSESLFQQYTYKSRYARFLWDEKRRETWDETVDRYINFFKSRAVDLKADKKFFTAELWAELRSAIYNLEVMPSMRALMTAGIALERDHAAGFNCWYTPIDTPRAFDEVLYLLMCGGGVGFSVEQKYVSQLPTVAEDFFDTDTTIVVQDSKLGWAKSLKELIHLLYGGQVPKIDYSKLRKAGEPLKTFGGRASGPEPLAALHDYVITTFKNAAGRKLTSLECHDIICKEGECVVVGGVRRSAEISLSDLHDEKMRYAKFGQWYNTHVHRALSNNSFVLEDTPDIGTFMHEWLTLYKSKSGERGIFSRKACREKVASLGRRDPDHEFGTNPCSEIILRPKQACNLSEVVVRANDNATSLHRKVLLATILGTLQSTLTDFRYLSAKWKQNCEEERLLGVSLTGILDNQLMSGKHGKHDLEFVLMRLRETAIDTNVITAKALGINPSVAVTCVKPSGTVSARVDSSSGIHARHAPYYIRRVRGDSKDPLVQWMISQGFVSEPDVTKPGSMQVFSFPVKAPEGSVMRDELTAIEHLELWLTYYRHWCEHKPSITVTVKEDEWMEVGAWVYRHIDEMSGVAFLPHSDHIYKQAPFEEITEEQYEALQALQPKEVDWAKLAEFEKYDTTTGSQELACSSGFCELT